MDGVIDKDHKFQDEFDLSWSEYDKAVASIHIRRYGRVIVDSFGLPIDNEYLLMEIEKEHNLSI